MRRPSLRFMSACFACLCGALFCLAAATLAAPSARADVVPDGKRQATRTFAIENVAEFSDWVVFLSSPAGGSHIVVADASPKAGPPARAWMPAHEPALYAMKR